MLEGDLAPPMSNGEVVFEAPWQGRVFGMAKALADAGVYHWDEFRARLIEEIGAWDRSAARSAGAEFVYYDHFLQAFERLLQDKGLVSTDGLDARTATLRARPPGHDHDHAHPHGHPGSHGHEPA